MKRRRESEDFSSDIPASEGEVNEPSVSPPETTSSPLSPESGSPDSLLTPANNEPSATTNGNTEKMSQQPASKIVELDYDNGNLNTVVMKCYLPPHPPMEFSTYGEYESHYYSTHANRCNECGKNFPSDHILGLHIEEIHDPFVAVKKERGDKTVCDLPPRLFLLSKEKLTSLFPNSSHASSRDATGSAQLPRRETCI